MAKRRLEIAHFWQEVCLSISVCGTDCSRDVDTSIDTGPTRIRLRTVDAVEALPRPSGWKWWLGAPVLVVTLGIAAAMANDGAEPDIVRIATRLARPCDACPPPGAMAGASIGLPLEPFRMGSGSGRGTECSWTKQEEERRPCVRGEVFAIANASGKEFIVRCSDPTVNTAPLASLGVALLAAPDSIAGCRFSSDGVDWRYSLAIRRDELARRRPPPDADACAPYTWHFEIDENRVLRAAAPHSCNLSFLPARPRKMPSRSIHIDQSGPVVSTGLDPALVRAVVEKHLPHLQSCYERRLAEKPMLAGKVLVEFSIAGDGFVSVASVDATSTLADQAVHSCLTARFRAMRFPAPRSQGTVEVKYPFELRSGSR